MTDTSDFFDMNAAPMRIGTVTLKVRDLDTVSSFYQRVLGLIPAAESKGSVTLGANGTSMVTLHGDPTLSPGDPRQAGLFHTAFLLPSRADLGRWLSFVTAAEIRIQGASDHIVSEALYLSDPEGNGIEVYADRPVSRWRDQDGNIQMATERLDVEDLLKAAGETEWAGFPEGGSIGHVHLQVGDTAVADRFYRDVLGFDVAVDYPGATFYGSGGYHHQLAGNVWNSRGVAGRPSGTAGLEEVEIIARDADVLASLVARAEGMAIAHTNERSAVRFSDPWGTAIKIRK
ncbi:VOC family protein [Mesorhizobium sp. B2-3-15]|uniref:VOC family protein n=1 Tax=Mesorhizobium sp. B2-3-15 TaxID=2589949 RepID=UPI00112EF548|nr:VOC family protein [Mesorhizobium sp. B2-3-15]TPL71352.1 VOC family protein [Mesorhizobium sp. B2-3-15]